MSVLVANRGEVACRILRTLRALQMPSVAVYTPQDAQAAHVWLADAAVPLDAQLGARGYLDAPALLAAAQRVGATMLHPGYGFLSQSAAFADACVAAGLTFVGPSGAAMAQLGDKRRARQLAVAQNIPVVPGVEVCDTLQQAEQAAASLGFPLLIKAAAGGGGKGMRRVDALAHLASAFTAAAREAQSAFGDGRLFIEKCIYPARHIEVQVLGDGQRAMALGERECSLQRRYQKLLEESPAPQLEAPLRQALEAAAVRLVAASGYANAATVEFLLDAQRSFYFLEVNTRLQVEHPVTELCRGMDLVAAQLHLAQGGALAEVQSFAPRGHAIEVRLNAEDPSHNFLPSTGRILAVIWPQGPGIRVDAGIEIGTVVGSSYDNLLAKIIAWAPTRALCRARLIAALNELMVLGVQTNQAFLLQLLHSPAFVAGQTFTHTVASQDWPVPPPPAAAVAAAQAALQVSVQKTTVPVAVHQAVGSPNGDAQSPWSRLGAFRVGPCGA